MTSQTSSPTSNQPRIPSRKKVDRKQTDKQVDEAVQILDEKLQEHEAQMVQVRAIYRELKKRPYGATQAELEKAADVPSGTVRRVMTQLEGMANMDSLFLNRPVVASNGNRMMLARTPYMAGRAMVQRWRNMITRATNDVDRGEMLRMLTTCGNRKIERVALRVFDSYQDLQDRDARLRSVLDELADELDKVLAGEVKMEEFATDSGPY